MTKAEAAAYAAGGSLYRFDRMRRLGIMPKKIPGTALFDRKLIDAALDKIAGAGAPEVAIDEDDGFGEWRKKREERRRSNSKR